MTIARLSVYAVPVVLSVLAACSAPSPPAAPASTSSDAAAPALPGAAATPVSTIDATPARPGAAAGATAGAMAGDDVSTVAGVVAETMNSGGYTYARLTGSGNDLWIAATEMPLTVGEAVTAAVSMPMQNFHSRTLNRDFLLVYFVGQVARNGEALSTPSASASGVAMASSHAPAAAPGAASSAALGGRPAAARAPEAATVTAPMAPAPGGHTVADLWAKRRALSGTIVIVRGQVVKRNNEIMGKNWFHLQDGTGKADTGTHDLTITTGDMVNVGDVVTVTGTLLTNQNFGAGYAYDVMLENALVKK